jgi:hypothetical protein
MPEKSPTAPPRPRKRTSKQYPRTVKSRHSRVADPHNPMPPGHGGLGPKLSKETKQAALVTLLRQIDRGREPTQAVRALAVRYGCHEATIWRILGPYRRPTVKAATWHFKAHAYEMAKRVVSEGKPAELIDVLSRPNIGVLAPVVKQSGDGGTGLFVSVSIGSLGAAQAGAVIDVGVTHGDRGDQSETREALEAGPEGGDGDEPLLAR